MPLGYTPSRSHEARPSCLAAAHRAGQSRRLLCGPPRHAAPPRVAQPL